MTKTTFKIGDGGAKVEDVHTFIDELPIEKAWRLTIEEYKSNRSAAQVRLQWDWYTQAGGHLGWEKDEVHEYAKEKFAVPILYRDDPEYQEMIKSVQNLRKLEMNADADAIKKQIINLTSTTVFNVKQMHEFLERLERWARSQGVPLTSPEDLMHEAMKR